MTEIATIATTPNLAYFTIAQTGEVVGLTSGEPGVAKTKTTEAFARATGRKVYTLIGSIREPGDVGGYPYLTKTKTPIIDPSTGNEIDVWMQLVAPKWAMDTHINGDKWIIFIDELTTCPPAVQAALLRTIAEKVVGDLPLPKETWIMAACNPPGIAANGFELEPPMANRLCHLEWQTDWEAWDRGMAAGGRFPEPNFHRLPDDWRIHLPRIGTMMTAFRRHKPALFQAYPNDRSKAGGAWPSPRSWHNAAICRAAVESIGGEPALQYRVVEGCVGFAAANEFMTWETNLDLPDPEELLVKAIKANGRKKKFSHEYPKRADKVIAMLGSVADRAINHNPNKERWEAAVTVYNWVAEQNMGKEIAVSCVQPLIDAKPKGANISGDFIDVVIPLLQKTGQLNMPG